MRSVSFSVLAAATMIASACASNPPPAPTPKPVEMATVPVEKPAPKPMTPVVTPPPVPTGPKAGSKADFAAKATDRVYFDYDQYALDDSDRRALASQVSWLKQFPNTRVEIQGNADERGTLDYNIALGGRRADAVSAYLKSQGIDGSRIQTISFGKSKPLDMGHDEAAWSKNRNAYTNIILEAVS